MQAVKQEKPLFHIEGKPVFKGELLFHSDFDLTGGMVTAAFPPEGNQVTVRTQNGAVPTVRLDDLSLKPKEEDMLRHAFQIQCRDNGVSRVSNRDFAMWKLGRAFDGDISESAYIEALRNKGNG